MPNEKTNEKTANESAQAVYNSALAALDALPDHDDRCLVVLNWARYIVAQESIRLCGTEETMDAVFRVLCLGLGMSMAELPEKIQHSGATPCGRCKRCKAAGIKPPETTRDESAN